MKTAAADYAWFNDLPISEAGCVTVVPAADPPATLTAFGALADTARPCHSLGALVGGADRLPDTWVYVVAVDDALVLLEDNGFQGTRPEVLRAASKASGTHRAAAFFWNVNGQTDFAAARRGKMQCSVELIGAEPEDLDGVPRALHRLLVEGGSEEGDLLGAGGALVAAYTEVAFRADRLLGGTFYETEPPPSALTVYHPGFSDIHGLPGVTAAITALSPPIQRRLSEWLTVSAVREGGIQDEPSVQRVVGALGDGQPPALPPGLDALARRTEKAANDFSRLEDDLEVGGSHVPEHPYHRATGSGPFGEHSAISHLEGLYLRQRSRAVETVRYVTHVDPLSAAVECLRHTDLTFAGGRTTRGWLFEKDERGRRRTGSEPNPRHQQFRELVTTLIDTLSLAGDEVHDDVWAMADEGLPPPLTEPERIEAIHADAEAAVRGEFDTYQYWSSAEPEGESIVFFGEAVLGEALSGEVAFAQREWDGSDEDDSDDLPAEYLAQHLEHLELSLTVARAPQQFLDLVRAADSREACMTSLREAFGFDTQQALMALHTPVLNLTGFGLADLQAQHDHVRARLADEPQRHQD